MSIWEGQLSLPSVMSRTNPRVFLRAIASNSLSIWTHNMRGLSFYKSFQPYGCNVTINATAVTMAAGEQWGDIYA